MINNGKEKIMSTEAKEKESAAMCMVCRADPCTCKKAIL
jgi:hypothetical protein